MKTLAVIPARLGATRLPRKPLRLIGGVPLIVRVWQRVVEMSCLDHTVVATDSEDIARVVQQQGGEAVMTREDHMSGTDRVAEVASLERFQGFGAVVNVQGDEPFVAESAIRGAVELVQSGRFLLATAAGPADAEILHDPNVVKVVVADDGRALYFSRASIPYLRDESDRAALAANVRQHIGLYVYSKRELERWVALPVHPLERIERLEQLRPLAAGFTMGVAVIDEAPRTGVDTEADLTIANRMWDELYAGRTS